MSNIQDSLAEIAVTITVQVAEVLSNASKNMEPSKRAEIDEMIQTQLPDVILNTLYKTTVLHSDKGIDHLKENLDYYVLQFAERFVKNDM